MLRSEGANPSHAGSESRLGSEKREKLKALLLNFERPILKSNMYNSSSNLEAEMRSYKKFDRPGLTNQTSML
jgi:hypothetical protein